MIDSNTIDAWFPRPLHTKETLVHELSSPLAAMTPAQVLEAPCPGVSTIQGSPEKIRTLLCSSILQVFVSASARLIISYCQTVVAVALAWMTPNGASIRRNGCLALILVLHSTIHDLVNALASSEVSHIRVLARAFPPNLQLLMRTTPEVRNAEVDQAGFKFRFCCVFDSTRGRFLI